MVFPKLARSRDPAPLSLVAEYVAAVVVCVVLPFFIQTSTLPQGWREPEAFHTALASLTAFTFGLWLKRSIFALPGARESSTIFPSQAIAFAVVLTGILFFRLDYSRAILLASFALAVAWLYLAELTWGRRRALVIGAVAGGRIDLLEELDGIETVPLTLRHPAEGCDAICADFRFPHSEEWEARITDYVLAGKPVYHAKDLHESITGRVDLEHLSENTFGTLGPLAPFQQAKAIIDPLIAIPVLVVLGPLLLVVAALIRLDSPGPALFRQERIGYRGRPFVVYKFRTMRVHADRTTSPDRSLLVTQAADQRITRLGRLLRRSRIDELPQIFNILGGEMSWIGPRPEASALSEWYEGAIPFYRYRHIVVPGITGWAQVSQGHVAEVADVRTKLQFDFYYIRNFSIWLDLLIIAKTIKTMGNGFGSK